MIELKQIYSNVNFGNLTNNQRRLVISIRVRITCAIQEINRNNDSPLNKTRDLQYHLNYIRGLIKGYCIGLDETAFLDATKDYDPLIRRIEKLLYMALDRKISRK